MNIIKKLVLIPYNDVVYRVLTDEGAHVGNLKRINAAWKFKAIGYEPEGDIVPGGGPLTHRHNLSFDLLDEAEICRCLSAA